MPDNTNLITAVHTAVSSTSAVTDELNEMVKNANGNSIELPVHRVAILSAMLSVQSKLITHYVEENCMLQDGIEAVIAKYGN